MSRLRAPSPILAFFVCAGPYDVCDETAPADLGSDSVLCWLCPPVCMERWLFVLIAHFSTAQREFLNEVTLQANVTCPRSLIRAKF